MFFCAHLEVSATCCLNYFEYWFPDKDYISAKKINKSNRFSLSF